MPKICYDSKWRPNSEAQEMIELASSICTSYANQGYDVTLRQLYYQFVSQDLFPDSRCWSWAGGRWVRDANGSKNAEPNYKWLGDLINKARLAGMLDWDFIVDRTRELTRNPHWDNPDDIVAACASSFRLDKWASQQRRVEIWIEKQALAGVVARVAQQLDVDFFSCRGYVSQSEQWRAGRRLGRYLRNGQAVTVLHLGDHDPSGIDMTRDITARLREFIATDWRDDHHLNWDEDVKTDEIFEDIADRVDAPDPLVINRIALNMDQVLEYGPPPNPTKLTDTRAPGYVNEHGHESWELDALGPDVLADLIREHVEMIRDPDRYEHIARQEHRHRELLELASNRWDDVVAYLRRVDRTVDAT